MWSVGPMLDELLRDGPVSFGLIVALGLLVAISIWKSR